MSMDKATVANIARLARLKLSDDELDLYARELSGIFGWIEQLQAVDTGDAEPMSSVVERLLPEREDVVTDGGIQEDVLANAPDAAHGYYVVPKVVE
ncbi:MAG: Asp-tRNA(Asn)/Glu-tRNA(Gln) amidotransferase subunit GatC [Alphaproteobacteria bacterium]|nr:Asp-tRNA(Asn)/Glu-tRNA(Gln) amidotransferase subunit GatC [Alphaproteobacteria bacterium]MBU0795817.1 Asp-tRNA(Asn)/Glu-tRNA(Gln) amidotransferase subunit GatC [Alphaproteobacteria bacterium]MBU0886679.1 Asp-tRNA(Asn)/Glu-tRNA(Gln) amidotransferase subunit GatC [Alphaproteobacteria bacterium]MBU1814534.1 Asp-tRNA(Asn)/Glu-tRNA(Gln) amidotransferase subunit GatC [Alphaproteobacteria bacterium]MBU2090884.1 Asp-tRNA(Asn)/Glu-tRNA(Gln) amidotransferase subunit GatC [Alphaproteobacteria bacterium